MSTSKRLPFDPELERLLEPLLPRLQAGPPLLPKIEDILPSGLRHEEHTFPGPDGNELTVSVISKETTTQPGKRPAIYHIHGGGMIVGDRFTTITWYLEAVKELDLICVSIEYRLAPDHPDPAPVEDCYAGLVWTANHADELGIDLSRLLIGGPSAGGGLSAGVALLARDRNGPKLLGQILSYPMIDDRDATHSTHEFAGVGVWDRAQNLHGWTCLLGERRGTENVSIYAAPARATDLSGLPPAFIDVGSTETFRDEDIEYAQKLLKNGVQCELHVWPGGFHGFDIFIPDAALSVAARRARMEWTRRILQL